MQNDSAKDSAAQGSRFPTVSDVEKDELYDLREVRERWAVSVYAVYQAVRAKKLRQLMRRGRRAYYSDSELRAVFGPPRGECVERPGVSHPMSSPSLQRRTA